MSHSVAFLQSCHWTLLYSYFGKYYLGLTLSLVTLHVLKLLSLISWHLQRVFLREGGYSYNFRQVTYTTALP